MMMNKNKALNREDLLDTSRHGTSKQSEEKWVNKNALLLDLLRTTTLRITHTSTRSSTVTRHPDVNSSTIWILSHSQMMPMKMRDVKRTLNTK